MKYLNGTSNNPYYNLAAEEYLLKEAFDGEDILYLWQNEPTIVIGRNQNTIEEINEAYVKENQIHVVRRLSGGGAVYHDLGNLNFTFITKANKDSLSNYKHFTQPVIRVLNEMGVAVYFSGRNDILLDGKKISGNAQYYYKDRMFHHGTLLFDSDLDAISAALNVNPQKIISKGVKSIRKHVTNISEYAPSISVKVFKEKLIQELVLKAQGSEIILTKTQKENIGKQAREKYGSWEWVYGASPSFEIKKEAKFDGGLMSVYFNVKEGKIEKLKIYGDFLSIREIDEVEKRFEGCQYREEKVATQLEDFTWQDYFPLITKEEFVSLLFQ